LGRQLEALLVGCRRGASLGLRRFDCLFASAHCCGQRLLQPLVKRRPLVKALADLKSWSWVALAGSQFWSNKEITLFDRDGVEQTLRISPVLISEGVTSIREAVRDGLGVSLLPDWLIKDELAAGELVQVLPKWKAKDLPIHVVYAGQRVLPTRVSAFIDFAVRYLSPTRNGQK
jgi:DNA-binding transcriptional LysR family regulator